MRPFEGYTRFQTKTLAAPLYFQRAAPPPSSGNEHSSLLWIPSTAKDRRCSLPSPTAAAEELSHRQLCSSSVQLSGDLLASPALSNALVLLLRYISLFSSLARAPSSLFFCLVESDPRQPLVGWFSRRRRWLAPTGVPAAILHCLLAGYTLEY